jgi:type I restriction enzyme M protein
MSEDQKRILEQQLWNIANTLRGKMNADELNEQVKQKIIKAKNEK